MSTLKDGESERVKLLGEKSVTDLSSSTLVKRRIARDPTDHMGPIHQLKDSPLKHENKDCLVTVHSTEQPIRAA